MYDAWLSSPQIKWNIKPSEKPWWRHCFRTKIIFTLHKAEQGHFWTALLEMMIMFHRPFSCKFTNYVTRNKQISWNLNQNQLTFFWHETSLCLVLHAGLGPLSFNNKLLRQKQPKTKRRTLFLEQLAADDFSHGGNLLFLELFRWDAGVKVMQQFAECRKDGRSINYVRKRQHMFVFLEVSGANTS